MDKQILQYIQEIASDEKKLATFLSNLDKKDRAFVEGFLSDIETHIEMDPLMKFQYNNDKQIEFLGFIKSFQFFIGGNKGGKTATTTFKGDLIALHKLDSFPRKATAKVPLIHWLCGENRDVLEQTPMQELIKWLRDDQYKIIRRGNYVDRVRVFPNVNNKKIYSDFIFKPYSGGVDIFESANVNGVIICDEEIPEAIFRALIPRMVAHGAWLLCALTPTHGITYTADVLRGTGSYSGLKGSDLVDWVEVATVDNIANIDPLMYKAMIATYAVHDQDGKIVLDELGNPKLTAEGEIRLLGKFASITGKVYPTFRRDVAGESWHVFDVHETPNLDNCKIFACSDYGRRDDFVYLLIAVDKNDTHWVLQEKYKNNLEVRDQAIAIREISDTWERSPLMVVADSQIKHRKTSGGTILDEYLTCVYPEKHERAGLPVLGYNFSSWRANPKDKLSPETARAELGRLLESNPATGKPSIRFSRHLTPKTINCLEGLQWRAGGKQEGTAGHDDHGEAALRYYAKVGVQYEHWESEDEMPHKQNHNSRYNIRGNYTPGF